MAGGMSERMDEMKILNFGSLNIDYVYQVEHMTGEGETQKSREMNVYVGGKGLNQSVALKRSGMEVYHAGLVGEDGDLLLKTCKKEGIDITYVDRVPGKCGHAIIQVDQSGQNCILLYGGSNDRMTGEFIDKVLEGFTAGDILILQNEINELCQIIDKAYARKMKIVLNPSPINGQLDACRMEKISVFIMNEIEGRQLSGGKNTPLEILESMAEIYSEAQIILTLGHRGSYYKDKQQFYYQAIYSAEVVDTTAAGDTFTGYFISGLAEGQAIPASMQRAAAAASLAISRNGAVPSIPWRWEVEEFLERKKEALLD